MNYEEHFIDKIFIILTSLILNNCLSLLYSPFSRHFDFLALLKQSFSLCLLAHIVGVCILTVIAAPLL